MPDATVRANAQAMPMDRRAALTSLFAAGATLAAPAIAAAAETPDARIFELVAEGKHWWAQIGVYCEHDERTAEEEERLAEAHWRYQAAFDEAVRTSPNSHAGARALLEWVRRDCDGISLPDEDTVALLDSLLASPLLREEA